MTLLCEVYRRVVPRFALHSGLRQSGSARCARLLMDRLKSGPSGSGLLFGLRGFECVAGVMANVDDVYSLAGCIDRIDDAVDVGLVSVEQMAEGGIFWDRGVALWMLGQTCYRLDQTVEPLPWRLRVECADVTEDGFEVAFSAGHGSN